MKRIFIILFFLISACTTQGPSVFETSDGVSVSADYLKGSGYSKGKVSYKAAVVLLHNLGGSKKNYGVFSEYLNEKGFSTLAVDFRGHGSSGGSKEDYEKYVLDVRAAKEFLKSKGYEKIYLMGGSIGANVAFRSAAEDNDVEKIILLSPGENYKGITIYDVVDDYRGEMYIATSENVETEVKFAWDLKERYRGTKKLAYLSTEKHGDKILEDEKDYAQILWFMTR